MSQRISTSLAVSFCALLLFAEVGFAQENNPTVYPYGGVPDKSRHQQSAFLPDPISHISLGLEPWMEKTPLNFNKLANFGGARFDIVAYFSRAKFNGVADFTRATFGKVYFIAAKFDNVAYFSEAKFDDVANFTEAKFDDVANFSGAKFDSVAYFSRATFGSVANFSRANFKSVASFSQARFRGTTVGFTETDFTLGVDFRQTFFDSVRTLYLENITFPDGKLRFYWYQFQAKDSLRIKIEKPPADSLKQEHYTRIEIIYHRLRDNFVAQDDKSSADAVMYELEWQRKEILKEFWWKMYGFFFGWGYQSWRFLLFVIFPTIIGFAVLWFVKYYEVLQKVIFDTELNKASALTKKQDDLLQKVWHSLFFSSSVLLGIRFKKAWIIKHRKFLYWASLEWALGIGLIITFALLVKGARFGFIRDLLGF